MAFLLRDVQLLTGHVCAACLGSACESGRGNGDLGSVFFQREETDIWMAKMPGLESGLGMD